MPDIPPERTTLRYPRVLEELLIVTLEAREPAPSPRQGSPSWFVDQYGMCSESRPSGLLAVDLPPESRCFRILISATDLDPLDAKIEE